VAGRKGLVWMEGGRRGWEGDWVKKNMKDREKRAGHGEKKEGDEWGKKNQGKKSYDHRLEKGGGKE